MNNEQNPYRAPESAAAEKFERLEESVARRDKFVFIAWPIVLGLNLIVPGLFGVALTELHGRWGMALGVLLFLAAGWGLCHARADLARKLIFGSILTALSQFFPIMQVVAGILAIDITQNVFGGVANAQQDAMMSEQITSELAGFVVTFLVGAMIGLVALVIGLVLGLILPKRWFPPKGTAKGKQKLRIVP